MNNERWNDWANLYCSDVRAEQVQFVENTNNISNNVGILTIKDCSVFDIIQASDSYAPINHPDLTKYSTNPALYDCFVVGIEMNVHSDSNYFSDGISYRLMTLVLEDNCWHIGALSYCPAELYSELDLVASTRSTAMYNPGTEPRTITVLDGRGVIGSVSFTRYMIDVTCNEIGNLGFDADAVKAQIVAAKMVGWRGVVSGVYHSNGYDIKHGMVAYPVLGENLATASNEQTITGYVQSLCGVKMLSSGGKVFFADYSAGSSNGGNPGSGKLWQYGAQYLATNNGYTWIQILRHYYDNSMEANISLGTTLISGNGNHTAGSTYSSNTGTHWKNCTKCNAKVPASAHTWLQVGTGYRCSVCGKTSAVIPEIQSFSADCVHTGIGHITFRDIPDAYYMMDETTYNLHQNKNDN